MTAAHPAPAGTTGALGPAAGNDIRCPLTCPAVLTMVRAATAGESCHDDADLDKQQDLKDAKGGEQGDAHSPVSSGRQQRVPGKRETGDDDRRGNDAVHA